MYDVKDLEATPGMARKLVAYSGINGMKLSKTILDLAEQDLLRAEDYPFLNPTELEVAQYVRDWNHRCAVVYRDQEQVFKVARALIQANTRPGPVVIITRQTQYRVWAEMLRTLTEDPIVVLSHARYNVPDVDVPNVTMATSYTKDNQAKWLVTSYGNALANNLVNMDQPSLVLMDELDSNGSINYKWTTAVQGMMRELPQFVAFMNFLTFDNAYTSSTNPRIVINRSNSIVTSSFGWFANHLQLATPMFANVILSERIDAPGLNFKYEFRELIDLIPLIGINAKLADSGNDTKHVHVYNNSFQADHMSGNQATVLERDSNLMKTLGMTLSEIARAAKAGDAAMRKHIDTSLKGTQWAYYKTQFAHQSLPNVTGQSQRVLIYATNEGLRRHFKLTQNCLELTAATANNTAMAYVHWIDSFAKSNNNRFLMFKDIDLLTQEILEATQHLVLLETPLDPVEFDLLMELADHMGIRVTTLSFRGTFEECVTQEYFQLPE